MFINVNGMSVKEFSREFNIPYRSVHEYLSDKRSPSVEQMTKMAERGIDINWLITGRAYPALVFDLSIYEQLKPIEGIMLADRDLYNHMLLQAVAITNAAYEKEVGHPLGINLTSIFATVWTVLSFFGNALDEHREKVEKLRSDGWTSAEIADLFAAEPVKKWLADNLKVIKDDES